MKTDINSEFVGGEIKKIVRQLEKLSDACRKTVGDSAVEVLRKRKIRSAFENSMRYLRMANKNAADIVTVPSKQALPSLTRESLKKCLDAKDTINRIASKFGVNPYEIRRLIRMFQLDADPTPGGKK